MSDVIVSFTSYPDRISTIDKILDSIIEQTILPDKIVLYLSSDEFENYNDMPDLIKYKKYGFEIHWYKENLKSHKKWYYAFQEYPDDIIITIDDDILYSAAALENLLKYHKQFPKAVIARRAHLITWNSEKKIASYEMWYSEYSGYVGLPKMDLFATGCAGILYPSNIFKSEIFNKDVFMKICPYADDIWLKIMEIYSGVPVVLAEKTWEDYVLLKYQENGLFNNHNRSGGNDEQLKALLKQYMYTYDGKDLEMSMFSKERKMCSEINNLKAAEMKKAMNELLTKVLMEEKILIYGAGKLGKQLYKWMKYNKIQGIKSFIVSDMADNSKYIDSVPVKVYTEFIRSSEKIVMAIEDPCQSYAVYEKLLKKGVDENRIVLLNRLEKRALIEI